jgi:hypothetical protein
METTGFTPYIVHLYDAADRHIATVSHDFDEWQYANSEGAFQVELGRAARAKVVMGWHADESPMVDLVGPQTV